MAQNYIQDGRYIDYSPSVAVASGELLEIGSLYGVSLAASTGSTQPVSVALEGVYQVPKTTGAGTALVVGAPVYFDASAPGSVSGDDESAANPLCGYAVEAAADGVALGKVRLLG